MKRMNLYAHAKKALEKITEGQNQKQSQGRLVRNGRQPSHINPMLHHKSIPMLAWSPTSAETQMETVLGLGVTRPISVQDGNTVVSPTAVRNACTAVGKTTEAKSPKQRVASLANAGTPRSHTHMATSLKSFLIST